MHNAQCTTHPGGRIRRCPLSVVRPGPRGRTDNGQRTTSPDRPERGNGRERPRSVLNHGFTRAPNPERRWRMSVGSEVAEARGGTRYRELFEALARPFEAGQAKQRPGGRGRMLDYIT